MTLRKHKVPFSKIQHIFISHMHGDHVLGLPGLIGSMNLLGRREDLNLFGPEALEPWLMENLRLTATHLQFRLNFNALPPGESLDLLVAPTFRVKAFPTKHRIPTHGFRIDEHDAPGNILREAIALHQLTFEEIRKLKSGKAIDRGGRKIQPLEVCLPGVAARSYAFAADTRPCAEVIEAVKGVNVLYHEATFKEELQARAKETGHSTGREAGEVAAAAKVEKLIVGHFSARYKDLTPLLDEARASFHPAELAYDGMLIRL